ncbi:MAG TPA: signal recognition particle-docking protein FtsY [Candidatus Nanoarchaeia archaeon]|nr:signal recognition particle-docking protein FtsY [Candidatus Nanoarchaeia archaeon]
MFKFLKEKLSKGIKSISGQIEEEGKSEEAIIERPVVEEKKGFFSKLKDRFKKEEFPEEEGKEQEVKITTEAEEQKEKVELEQKKEFVEKKEEEIKEKIENKEIPNIQELTELKKEKEIIEKAEEAKKEEQEMPKEEKKGIFGTIKEKIVTKKINDAQFEKIFWDMEVSLLENNIAVEVIEKIKDDLKQELVEKPLPRGKIEEVVQETLYSSLEQILGVQSFNLLEKAKKKKPFVICFVGINGSGKTTTIAKMAKLLQENKLSIVLAAADTFRAASIEQLQLHAEKLGAKLIKHNYGSDPAAVAFDAVKYAQAKNIDVVLIDTAGRMHSNVNLTDEMKKIIRVVNPDLKIFVGESITGNDCVEQAKKFNEAIGIDGIILSKADIDEKGGAAVSIAYVTQKPILFIGTGQEYGDIKEFNPDDVISSLGIA